MFRPVVYRFQIQPHEMQIAKRILTQHGRTSLDFFKVQRDKSLFFSQDGEAFVSYAVGRNFAVVLGDPVGPPDRMREVVRQFADYCRDNDWGFGFYQTLPDFLDTYESAGLKKLQIGEDAIVDLPQFTLQGRSHRDVRSKVNQLDRSGFHAEYYEPPLSHGLLAELRSVSDEWLTIPGLRALDSRLCSSR
jgi:phosphatidylglycerol lysyltransferase